VCGQVRELSRVSVKAEKGRVLKLISDAALSEDQAALSEDQAPCSAICYYCCIIEEQVNDM
jgi:hypothetical protein